MVKREKTVKEIFRENNYKLQEIKTWFEWNECKCCGKMVRREPMWYIRKPYGTSHYDNWQRWYYCKECKPKAKDLLLDFDVDAYIEELDKIGLGK